MACTPVLPLGPTSTSSVFIPGLACTEAFSANPLKPLKFIFQTFVSNPVDAVTEAEAVMSAPTIFVVPAFISSPVASAFAVALAPILTPLAA